MENKFYVATLLFAVFYEVNFSRDMSVIYPWVETSSRAVMNNPRSACSSREFPNTFNPFSPIRIKGKILVHSRYKSQSNTTSLLFLKLHSVQHVSALESHHQPFLMNWSKINIYSAFGIPSVYTDDTVSIIVLWSDMSIYIHYRMCLKVKNRVYL